MEAKKMPLWKKLGWFGFFFFLIKGLVWLAIFAFAARECQAWSGVG